ncbi:MAG: AAA family ATPase [Lewinellaceae bacterium]|nr:AAA family ATPase [Lewinellaceae bacterium]
MPSSKDILRHQIRLLSLELRDFRGFRFLELDFNNSKPATILIADNGGGKTSVLDAVAGFLRYFLTEGIYAEKYELHFDPNDITNGEASSLCKIALELTYPYPAKELYEVCRDVADFLNDYKLNGVDALVALHAIYGQWQLFIDDLEDGIELPAYIVLHLDSLLTELDENNTPKLKPGDSINVAHFNGEVWVPNLNLAATGITKVSYTGQIDIIYELNKSRGKYQPKTKKKTEDIEEFIDQLAGKRAFLEDFRESAKGYRHEDKRTVLPLLVYYGGGAINTKFGDINILYKTDTYQAYHNALDSNRFDFAEFFTWFNTLKEGPEYVYQQVQKAIKYILDSEEEIYENLRVEHGKLKIDKQFLGQVPLPLEVTQLSAGEKNLFALIGDLVKRSIQLNPLLFEIDYDPSIGSYYNILVFTEGIVLIDEIDLHLHPKWQRMILPKLRELFPKVQFLVTTHSPFVLQSIETGNIVALPSLEKWKGLSGWEIYEIIQEAMADEGDSMSDKYQKMMECFRKAILSDDYEALEESYNWLVQHLHPENPKRPALEMQYNVFTKKGEYK